MSTKIAGIMSEPSQSRFNSLIIASLKAGAPFTITLKDEVVEIDPSAMSFASLAALSEYLAVNRLHSVAHIRDAIAHASTKRNSPLSTLLRRLRSMPYRELFDTVHRIVVRDKDARAMIAEILIDHDEELRHVPDVRWRRYFVHICGIVALLIHLPSKRMKTWALKLLGPLGKYFQA